MMTHSNARKSAPLPPAFEPVADLSTKGMAYFPAFLPANYQHNAVLWAMGFWQGPTHFCMTYKRTGWTRNVVLL
jgi:hypothetical protein